MSMLLIWKGFKVYMSSLLLLLSNIHLNCTSMSHLPVYSNRLYFVYFLIPPKFIFWLFHCQQNTQCCVSPCVWNVFRPKCHLHEAQRSGILSYISGRTQASPGQIVHIYTVNYGNYLQTATPLVLLSILDSLEMLSSRVLWVSVILFFQIHTDQLKLVLPSTYKKRLSS